MRRIVFRTRLRSVSDGDLHNKKPRAHVSTRRDKSGRLFNALEIEIAPTSINSIKREARILKTSVDNDCQT